MLSDIESCVGKGFQRLEPSVLSAGVSLVAQSERRRASSKVRPSNHRVRGQALRCRRFEVCYLVDPASSHMLVSKIKPCMSKYELIQTVKLRMAH